jgi:tetratricopeptide (TPR) repeat protein
MATPDFAPIGLDDAASAFAHAVIGGQLSPQASALLAQAAAMPHQADEAQALLERARAVAPAHPAPLVALYRFHFYGHRLAQARQAGEDALAVVRGVLGPDFGDQPPSDEQARGDVCVRFYLFALKGLAYLSLRLGQLDEAVRQLRELKRLDPGDHVGGALLWHVLAHHLSADDPDLREAHPTIVGTDNPLRGWDAGAPLH